MTDPAIVKGNIYELAELLEKELNLDQTQKADISSIDIDLLKPLIESHIDLSQKKTREIETMGDLSQQVNIIIRYLNIYKELTKVLKKYADHQDTLAYKRAKILSRYLYKTIEFFQKHF